MYQNVPKGYDVPVVPDMLKHSWLIAVNAIQSLPYDLELPLDRAAKLFVGRVVVEGASADKPLYGLSCLNDFVQMGKYLILHRAGSFPRGPVS